MKIKATGDSDFTANISGVKVEFFYKNESKGVFEIRSNLAARKTLNDWSRTKIPLADVLVFQDVAKLYVGCTVDDVQYTEDKKSFLINGKALEAI